MPHQTKEIPAKARSQSASIEIHILGIGEITTTIEVKGEHWGKFNRAEKRWMRLAYKRMPSFDDKAASEHYIRIHNEYQDLLVSLGIAVPWHDNLATQKPDGRLMVYNRQERWPTRQVSCLAIQDLDADNNLLLFRRLLEVMAPLFKHNQAHPELLLGFDGQIPNWIMPAYNWEKPAIRQDEAVIYIDTSTPLVRKDGKEQLDTELFLKSVPVFIRPLIRSFMLQGILDRYYIAREVIKDLIASYITHGRPDLVPMVIEEANRFMAAHDFSRQEKPFSVAEIKSYNREDVFIWKFFRTMKRFDRLLTERLFKKTYEQRLPDGSPAHWKNLVGAGGKGLSPED